MWSISRSYGYSQLEDITQRSSEIGILKTNFELKLLSPFYIYECRRGPTDAQNLASVEYKVSTEEQYSFFHSIVYSIGMELPSKNNLSVNIDHDISCGVFNFIITHGEDLIFI